MKCLNRIGVFPRKAGHLGARLRARLARREAAQGGVIILTCDRPARGITPKGFALAVGAFMLIKGAAIAHLGPAAHAEAIRSLRAGGLIDQAAAFIMAPDAVSLFISDQLSSPLG